MSGDEDHCDTFRPQDLTYLREATHRRMPGYRPAARENGRIAWMVLEPDAPGPLPRFTICRIDPCIMVQIEEADERRFVSVASLDDAIVIAERAVAETSARRNVHATPQLLQ